MGRIPHANQMPKTAISSIRVELHGLKRLFQSTVSRAQLEVRGQSDNNPFKMSHSAPLFA
ncbi:hypothetical protein DTL21_19020 [Bremerella cremea]|uniref:Uncharacterized protein n=1 Tax=Blastopirellula marina TaxID=124 RepID=A0A2S8FJH8_9BACT|nr:hypothetical protein C5Y83_19000 [Blastopirellula marina]RCS45384.1 hypothetical protein DTL21_19020 [Bremerella cremea]